MKTTIKFIKKFEIIKIPKRVIDVTYPEMYNIEFGPSPSPSPDPEPKSEKDILAAYNGRYVKWWI